MKMRLYIYCCRVFGSYALEEFGGQAEPEEQLLSLARSFLLHSDPKQGIAWNIQQQLSKEYVPSDGFKFTALTG